MSTNLPVRTTRIPALQRQCLFLRHQRLQPFAASASRTFSSTNPNAFRKKGGASLKQDKAQTEATARAQTGPSPRVNFEKAQRDEGAMAEDIGLLQNTIVRAPFKYLPSFTSRQFWSYFWTLLKAKGTALYTRSVYKQCIRKQGWRKYIPIDSFNGAQLKHRAEKYYLQICEDFAKGDIKPIQGICLPPLAQKFQNRIAARDPTLVMKWSLCGKVKSTRIVSHRATPLGEDHPDTAYRQIIVRIESVQSLSIKHSSHPSQRDTPSRKYRGWMPEEAQKKAVQQVPKEKGAFRNIDSVDNGAPKTVVEYLVMQKRVIRGREEDWKVWGFAEESTPARIEDDEAYWRKTLALQTAGGEAA